MSRYTRDKFLLFLDVSKGTGTTPEWARVNKSTILEYSMNEVESENNYIDAPEATTDITGYAPEIPEEIITDGENAVHNFIAKEFYDMPIGDACKVPCLFCFPPTEETTPVLRAHHADATITKKVLNPVDQKYTFSLKFSNIIKGTYTISAGVPTWVPPSSKNSKVEKKVEEK